jgi:hypothetical protein
VYAVARLRIGFTVRGLSQLRRLLDRLATNVTDADDSDRDEL